MIRRFSSVCFVGLLLTCCLPVTQAEDRPNVLIVITDEHNFRTLGCYREIMSQEQAEMWGPDCIVATPQIDRLANEGVMCTRAYATAPVCSPSRAAMITGLYPHQTGVPTNNEILRDDIPTLATILADKGYRTGFVGKWHLGGNGKPEWAPQVDGGFQHKAFMFNRGHWKKFVSTEDGPAVGARDNKGHPSYAVDDADEKTFATDFLTDRIIDFMETEAASPFLAVVSYPDPHGPNTVRQPYDHMYDHLRFLPPRTYGRDDLPVPGWLGGGKNHAKFVGDQMSRYFGMVKCIDDNFGRILKSLEANGKLDSTLILLTSDHGDLCYEHDRLNKGNPYEGSARVPMLLRYPATLPRQLVYRDPMGTVDITPTVLSAIGVASDAKFEGRDLTESFRAGSSSDEPTVTFLRNAGKAASWVAVVDSRYKLVLSVGDRPWLLDAHQDPDELLNFYQRPGTNEATKRLATKLKAYALQTADPFFEHEKIAQSLQQCLAVGKQ